MGVRTSGLSLHSLRSPGTARSISPAPHTAPRWRSQHRPTWEPLRTGDGVFGGSRIFAATSPPATHASTPPPGRSLRAQSGYAGTPGGPQYGYTYSPPSSASEDTTDFIISHAPHLSERFSYSAPRAVRSGGGGTPGRPYANRMFWSDRKEERDRDRDRDRDRWVGGRVNREYRETAEAIYFPPRDEMGRGLKGNGAAARSPQ